MLTWEQLRPGGLTRNMPRSKRGASDALIAVLAETVQRNNWTRAEAALAAGVSQTAVTNILNGERRPTKETLAKIAHGWRLSLDYLLELDGVPLRRGAIAEQATAGLSDDQLAWLASLDPEERRRVVEAVRRLRGPDTPS
jgi:transcriptional regulator with XRE-family HTH domain